MAAVFHLVGDTWSAVVRDLDRQARLRSPTRRTLVRGPLMRPNGVRDAWAVGRPALGAWLTIASAFAAEIVAHAKFDWICVDMQHGVIDYAQMVTMLQAVSSTPVTPLVRVPWNEPGIIGKSLDAGARGVIIPMVNSRADAERAVQACRYAPVGARSYGPVRASYYVGFDYFANANEDVLC